MRAKKKMKTKEHKDASLNGEEGTLSRLEWEKDCYICMADTMTKEQRSRCMAAIKGKDTKPELEVRKYLFSRGLRFRIQVKKLPGKPDIVLPKYKTVIFVNGCFWHGHQGCRYYRLPKSNVEFWRDKIDRNMARDAKNEERLLAMGWRVVRLWECEIRNVSDRQSRLERLYDEIICAQPYEEAEEMSIAAEPEEGYGMPSSMPMRSKHSNADGSHQEYIGDERS